MSGFHFECHGPGGITLLEKSRLSMLNRELAAILNILVDVRGETELRMDYPKVDWTTIWHKARNGLSDFCNKGFMFVGLLRGGRYEVGIHGYSPNASFRTGGSLHVKNQSIVFLETGELIQKILYPHLPLQILAEVTVDSGRHNISYSNENIDKGILSISITPQAPDLHNQVKNVVDLCASTHGL